MNSLQFVSGLRPFLANRDLGTLKGNDLEAIVQAINLTQLDWWDAAPMSASNQPCSFSGPGSRSVTLTVTAGSNVVTSTPAITAADIGRSIVLDGINVRNTILDPNTLLLAYVGTGSTVAATIYGDAFGLPSGFQQLNSPVWLEATQGLPRLPMARIDETWIYYLQPVPFFGSSPRPLYYSITAGETGAGIAPFQIMRFYPIPSTGVQVSFQYSGLPALWTVQDLVTSRALGLEDRAWLTMTDVVVQKLLFTGLLRKDLETTAGIQRVDKRAADALASIKRTPAVFRGQPVLQTQPGY